MPREIYSSEPTQEEIKNYNLAEINCSLNTLIVQGAVSLMCSFIMTVCLVGLALTLEF